MRIDHNKKMKSTKIMNKNKEKTKRKKKDKMKRKTNNKIKNYNKKINPNFHHHYKNKLISQGNLMSKIIHSVLVHSVN